MLFIAGLLLAYASFLIVCAFLWKKEKPSMNEDFKPLVSLLVPFRNEEQNLTALIDCLAQQNYQHWELIFIDDHSEDRGQSVLNKALAGFPHPF